MSIVTEIERIKQGVNNAITSIENKGVEVPETIKIDELHTYIDEITEFKDEVITDGRFLFLNDRFTNYASDITYELTGSCEGMFENTSRLNNTAEKVLDLNSLDMSNVTSLKGMFKNSNCKDNYRSLTNRLQWNTTNVTDISNMYEGYNGVVVDLTACDFSNVTDVSNMFNGAKITMGVHLPTSLNFENIKNLTDMFNNCTNGSDTYVGSLNLDVLTIGAATDVSGMFNNCNLIEGITLRAPNYTLRYANNTFANSSLKYLVFDSFNPAANFVLGNIIGKNVETVDIISMDYTKTTSTSNMCFNGIFKGCTELQQINGLENIVFNRAGYTFNSMFYNCSKLLGILDLTQFFNKFYWGYLNSTAKTESAFLNMFENCASLEGVRGISVSCMTRGATVKMFGTTLNESIRTVEFQPNSAWSDAYDGTLDLSPLKNLNIDTVLSTIPTYQGTAVKTLILNPVVILEQGQIDAFATKNITIAYSEPS